MLVLALALVIDVMKRASLGFVVPGVRGLLLWMPAQLVAKGASRRRAWSVRRWS